MPLPTIDPWAELDLLERYRRDGDERARNRARGSAVDPRVTQLADQMADRLPWLPKDVLFAFALDGRDASDPLVQSTAEIAGRQRSDSALGWTPPGTPVNVRGEFQRDAQRARNNAATPRVPPPENSAARAAWEQANQAGLVDRSGFLVEPGRFTSGDPKDYVFSQVRETFLNEGVPMPVLVDGRPAVVERTERTNSGESWQTRVTYLDGQENESDGGGHSLLGPGMSVNRAQTAGTANVNTAIRHAGMAAAAPMQEATGLFRAAYSGQAPSFQSDLAVQIANPDMSAGGGFFVDNDSPVAEERRRREARYGLIDGHRITPGRALAHLTPLQPGSRPYSLVSGLTDAAVQLYGDPTSYGLGKADEVLRARSLIQADDAVEPVGGIRGTWRNAVSAPTVEQALTGDLAPVVQRLANTSSPTEVWRALGRRTDLADVSVRLADASTTDEVSAVLRPELGTSIRSTRDIQFRRTPSRWLSNLPGPGFNPSDRGEALFQLERHLLNAKVPDEQIVSVLDDVARARTRPAMFNAVMGVGGAVDQSLIAHGASNPTTRSEMTRLFNDTHEGARHWFVDEIGNDVDTWGYVNVGGNTSETMGPHLWSEMLSNWIELPDPRPIRSQTTVQQKILSGDDALHRAARFVFSAHTPSGQKRLPSAFLHSVNEWWRRGALMRPAWTLRVIGEEQARMAAAGYDSMFRHPASYIAGVIARKRGTDGGLLDDAWEEAEAFQRAMSQSSDWIQDPKRIQTTEFTIYANTDHDRPNFISSWAEELAQLTGDPVPRQVAGSGTLDEAFEWFTRGDGVRYWDDLIEGGLLGQGDVAARRYLETAAHRIQVKTGGNQDLVNAIATGRLGEARVLDRTRNRATGEFRSALESYLDIAPQRVKGRITATAPGGTAVGDGLRHVTDVAFEHLMTKPTNLLSRSQVFKQAYWGEVRRLASFATAEARSAMTQAARDAGRSSRSIRGIERARGFGELSIEEVDFLAKGFALDETKSLLYDLSERGQVFDALKLVWPFGDAWQEVATTWLSPRSGLASPLSLRGLRNLRRFQQGIQGARGEQLGEFVGAPEGEGLIWENEFGEEVFVWPGSEFVTKRLLGVPVPLTGSVQGLSMFGTLMPGLGPVAQIPTAWFMDTKPGWAKGVLNAEVTPGATVEDYARDQLLPFGGPFDDGDRLAPLNVETWMPPWAVRTIAGLGWRSGDPESERLWANTTMQVMRFLASTGRYDLSSPEGMQELMEAASDKAEGLYLIRGLAGSSLPTAPQLDWLIEDETGNTVRLYAMLEDYRAMQEEDPSTATERFLDRYGENTFLVTQSFSRSNVEGLDPTRDFRRWVEANPDIVRDFPNTFGLFAPQDGTYDGNVYAAQIREGQREALEPNEWLRNANNARARMLIDQAYTRVGDNPTAEEQAWIRELKDLAADEFPGYDDVTYTRAKPVTLIRELVRAADNEAITDTPAGQALANYMRARSEAIEYARGEGYASFNRANALAPTRDWLRRIGDALVADTPTFAPIWRVLEREMVDDEPEDETDATP